MTSRLHSNTSASLTAFLRFCSDPRYRSVVRIDSCPSRNLICSNSPPFARHSFAAVRRRSCGASSPIPICAAYSRTSCHTARSVNASLPTRPFASTRRKIGPFSIPATSSHPSISCFTHSGTATDRVLFPFPRKSRNTQRPSRITWLGEMKFSPSTINQRFCERYTPCSGEGIRHGRIKEGIHWTFLLWEGISAIARRRPSFTTSSATGLGTASSLSPSGNLSAHERDENHPTAKSAWATGALGVNAHYRTTFRNRFNFVFPYPLIFQEMLDVIETAMQ